MTSPELPRILVVDDEEAILETMTFTFMESYEVLTASDARRGLELLDEHAPVAVVITDQRMPDMTGVEFLARVVERHPETTRIMLTGFADMEATIQAINEGHVYAYVNKPWEPEELKQLVRRAVEHFQLSALNRRLVDDLRRANAVLEAVMDRLDVGALALDPGGVVVAANRAARTWLRLESDPRGSSIRDILAREGLEGLGEAVPRLAEACGGGFEDVELGLDGSARRIRVSAQTLHEKDESPLGRVILFREVSHEPLRRRFDEVVYDVGHHAGGELRPRLQQALEELREISAAIGGSGVSSAGMAELAERVSRCETALGHWLDVDDVMAREDYPDAQMLLDRMRMAAQRWPGEELPARVAELARRVEAYYESGENPRERVL